jgi:hypothetical protein
MASDADAASTGAHSARARRNRRPKVTLDESETARLRLAAKARGMKPAAFMRNAVLAAITATEEGAQADTPEEFAPAVPAPAPPSMSSLLATAKDPSATVRKKVFLTPDENKLLAKEAKLAVLLQQDYMRLAVVAALTQVPPPKRKAVMSRNDLAHEIAMVAFQIKKAGTNLNQLAKQANNGLVPITRSEVLYFMNTHQRVLTLTTAALEKVLA